MGTPAWSQLDPNYEFIVYKDLETYFLPKRNVEVTPELLRSTGRGVGYTKSAGATDFATSGRRPLSEVDKARFLPL